MVNSTKKQDAHSKSLNKFYVPRTKIQVFDCFFWLDEIITDKVDMLNMVVLKSEVDNDQNVEETCEHTSQI